MNKAELRCGELVIQAPIPEIMRFICSFEAGEYEIKKSKKKRSLDANAYFWVLCDKIAEATLIPKSEVYQNAIREIGGISETIMIRNEAVKTFERSWCSGHLGRQIETRKAKFDGYTAVTYYYGSSDFNTAQMSRLIDGIVQDCESLEIETKPREYVDSLLKQWEGK